MKNAPQAPSRRGAPSNAVGWGAKTRSGRGRRLRPREAGERPLGLLTGRTRPMSNEEEDQLVGALAELLADWLADHPDRLPVGLRSARECGLVDGTRPKEQP